MKIIHWNQHTTKKTDRQSRFRTCPRAPCHILIGLWAQEPIRMRHWTRHVLVCCQRQCSLSRPSARYTTWNIPAARWRRCSPRMRCTPSLLELWWWDGWVKSAGNRFGGRIYALMTSSIAPRLCHLLWGDVYRQMKSTKSSLTKIATWLSASKYWNTPQKLDSSVHARTTRISCSQSLGKVCVSSSSCLVSYACGGTCRVVWVS